MFCQTTACGTFMFSAALSDNKRKNRRDPPQKVSSIANQLDSKNVELHFLRTSKNPSLREGGLHSLLRHRYIGSALRDDDDYTHQHHCYGSPQATIV